MLVHAKTLETFAMSAEDGELGKIDDVYMDAQDYAVRYFVGDTRTWFFGGKVLLSPRSFSSLDYEEGSVNVNATKEQIKDSPKPDEHAPIKRHYEQELSDHYGWPYYWAAPGQPGLAAPMSGTGGTPVPGPLVPPVLTERENKKQTKEDVRTESAEQEREARYPNEEQYLHSLNELIGYNVHARGGEFGNVTDFLLEEVDNQWFVRYFVADTGGVFRNEPTLISMDWIKEVTWLDHAIVVDMDREKLDHAPPHTHEVPLTRKRESELHHYYGRTPYWEK
ncbi:PRC-barrel domain-containing protein [Shouchella shacheensis]|uniref:PRC-barrel domain-containing protein n=1 Tax=Shouchella shacheensis TaxID=1649580 RepID=UPI00073FC38F|nr:PRC-barrel domain-containing protein [Shouchella shacheensis]